MKIKLVPALVSAGIAALAGYGFYAANASEDQKWLMLGIATGTFLILLVGGFGIKYADRGDSNITVLSVLFTIAAIIVNVIATCLSFHFAPYIIASGIIVLLYIGITNAIAKAL
ncbi:MAG: hypothetical protein II973_12435 [Spirochaetaceae bacterium]|nr:hypothetical protein [Spirochaetaceae bacterium]